LIVAGVMSGTSADGIDVALVRVKGPAARKTATGKTSTARTVKQHGTSFEPPRFQLLGHRHFPYSPQIQEGVLRAMNARKISVAELAQLNFLLGEVYADAIEKSLRLLKIKKPDLIGCHGQTIYHQSEPALFLGKKVRCTWQTGEGAVIAARLNVPVVSDFRPADIAAGGKGAPLVPFLDYVVFRDPRAGRVVQNIGGIANLTAIPAAATPENVAAFDTGPGNMVIDQLMQLLFDKPFDRSGETAQQGNILQALLERMLADPFFRQRPPKTAGREQFGREFVKRLLRESRGASKADVVATATALTAHSIARALKELVLPHGSFRDYVVSGGGTRNRTLMRMLTTQTSQLGLELCQSDKFGVPSQAKEAIAFALLAFQTWNRQPSNIPSATGAGHPAVLGKISYA